MIAIKVDNSISHIEGLETDELKKLRRFLSYTLDPEGKYSPVPRNISLVSKDGRFPTGLLDDVQGWLKKSGHQSVLNDHRTLPSENLDLTLKLPFQPRIEQIKASEAIAKHHRGIVVAPTGFGKSVVAALIIDKLRVSTLIVVPSIELKRQLTDALSQFFGAGNVGRNKPIYVCNIDGLRNKELTRQYHALIIDEFHRSASETYTSLNKEQWGSIYYRAGLTATPFRNQEHENIILKGVLSKTVYEVSYATAVKKGYIVPLSAGVVLVPKTKVLESNWQAVYKKLVVENKVRNDLIVKLLAAAKEQDVSTLCLVKEVVHGELLGKQAGVHFAHGTNEDTPILLDAFSSGKIKALVATTGVCGEGVDTRACQLVIYCGLGKSRPALMQAVGRAFRPYPGKTDCTVIVFNDGSHKWSRDHFKTQCQILLEEYGVEAQVIEI